VPLLPAMFEITCDHCGKRFGTIVTEVTVKGMTLRAICSACVDAIVRRDDKMPVSVAEWDEALKKSVSKPSRS
jgi:hypothetical protein